MKTIAVISQKGGSGKSTLAINLAIAAEIDNKTSAIIDIDPQASATEWNDKREKETPAIISAQSSRLPQMLQVAQEQGVDIVFIDTAPHSEKSALDAARIADLVIIPTKPTILDLMALNKTVDLIALAKANAFAVINASPPRGKLNEEACSVIEGYGLKVAPIISYRHGFFHSLTAGQGVLEFEPQGKAAEEITRLYMFICQHVNMSTSKKNIQETECV